MSAVTDQAPEPLASRAGATSASWPDQGVPSRPDGGAASRRSGDHPGGFPRPDGLDDDAAPSGGTGSRRRLRDWRVRSRLLALVAVPTVVAVVLGIVGLTGAVSSANAYGRAAALGRLANSVTDTAVALDDEQDTTTAFVAAGRPPALAADVAETQHRTDQATASLRDGVSRVGDAYPASTRSKAARAVFRLDALPALRAAAVTSQLSSVVVVDQYSAVGSDLVAVDDEIAQESADATLAASVRALSALSRARSVLADERALVRGVLTTGRFEPGAQQLLVDSDASRTGFVAQFRTAADLRQAQLYDDVVAGAPVDDTAARLDGLIRPDGPALPTGGPAAADSWNQAASGTLARLHTVESTLIGDINARADALRSSQITRAVVAGVVALAVLLIALLATLVVVRSLTRPLRALRRGAGDVAQERLPAMVGRLSREDPERVDTHVAPIGVESRYEFGADEIGEVARSFDDVHQEAVRLATAEARRRAQTGALVVNLSRRTQSLVERQIELIDDLERTEDDPDRLGELFRLDHLATRMRRNGENLLVLGGEEPLRRWNRVMALLDVLRAAVSEVEQYTRVDVAPVPDLWVDEAAVSDLVHLFAELVENATSFSARSTPVTVETTLLPDRSALVEVADQGIGLSEPEFTRINTRLAGGGEEALGSEVSRRMGLVVVARLAARRGVTVRLHPGAVGVVARVSLPTTVLAADPVRSDASPPTVPQHMVHAGGSGEGPDDGSGEGGSWLGERWSKAVATPGPGADSWFGGAPLAVGAAGAGAAVGAIGAGGGPDSSGPEASREPDVDAGEGTRRGELRPGDAEYDPTGFTPTAAGTTTSGLPQRAPGANRLPDLAGTPTGGSEPARSTNGDQAGSASTPAASTAAGGPGAAGAAGAVGTASAASTASTAWDRTPDAVRRRYAEMQRGRDRGLAGDDGSGPTLPDEQPSARGPASDGPDEQPAAREADDRRPLGLLGGPGDGREPGGIAEPARSPSAAGTTTSGLPRRTPGANYVPGSASTAEDGDADPGTDTGPEGGATPPEPGAGLPGPGSTTRLVTVRVEGAATWDRSANAIRARFAAHQQGRQRAREAGRS